MAGAFPAGHPHNTRQPPAPKLGREARGKTGKGGGGGGVPAGARAGAAGAAARPARPEGRATPPARRCSRAPCRACSTGVMQRAKHAQHVRGDSPASCAPPRLLRAALCSSKCKCSAQRPPLQQGLHSLTRPPSQGAPVVKAQVCAYCRVAARLCCGTALFRPKPPPSTGRTPRALTAGDPGVAGGPESPAPASAAAPQPQYSAPGVCASR